MIPAPVAVARNTSAAASPRTRKPSARSLPPQRHCGGSPTWPARSPPGSPPHTASTTPRTNSRPRPTPPSISFMMASSTRPSRRLEICSNASPTCTSAGIPSPWSTRREVIIRRPLIATAKSSTSFEPIPTATTPTSRPSSTSSSISSIHQPPPDRRAPPLTLSEGGAPVPIRYRAQNDRGVPSICVRGVTSTIGNGTQTAGLTVSGGATTTKASYFIGNVGAGTIAPVAQLDVTGLTLIRGSNTNTPPTPIAGLELFFGRTASGGGVGGVGIGDVAFDYGGSGGGYRHWITTTHNA